MIKYVPYKEKLYKCLIDKEDEELFNQYIWFVLMAKNTYYIQGYKKGDLKHKLILLHRLLMNSKPDECADHEDHRGWNNHKWNLRICTLSQNGGNSQKQKPKEKKCSSKHKGVYWKKQNQKYRVQIMFEKKHIHLGYYISEIKAAQAYNIAAKYVHKDFCNPNDVPEPDKEFKNKIIKLVSKREHIYE